MRSTLQALCSWLDRALRPEGDDGLEPWVLLSDLGGERGAEGGTRDKLVMTLAGLQSDATGSAANQTAMSAAGALQPPPPLRLNLVVLLTANFSGENYGVGLALLSNAVAFLQQHPVLTREQLPGLEAGVDRVALDFLSLDLSQTHSLVTAMGARYMPCAVYRLRALEFSSAVRPAPLIRTVELRRVSPPLDAAG